MPALTGLRFFLAALVLLFHVAAKPIGDAPVWIRGIVSHGYLAVNAFFILSGFVLAHTYLDARGQLKGSRRDFWAARFARIYPVYGLTMAFSFPNRLHGVAHPPAGWQDPAASLAVFGLVQAWIPTWSLWINSAAWSLSAEAFFYFGFPLLAKFNWNRPARGLLAVMGACWVLCLTPPVVASLAFQFGAPQLKDALTEEWVSEFLLYNPLFHVPAFVMGVAAQRLFLQEKSRAWINSWRPAAMSIGSIGLIVVVLGTGWPLSRLFVNNGLLGPAFACLIFALASGRGGVARALSGPTVVLLGEASYSLYLLHLPLWGLTLTLNALALHLAESSWAFVAADFVVTVAVSVVALKYVEKPYRISLRNAFREKALAADS